MNVASYTLYPGLPETEFRAQELLEGSSVQWLHSVSVPQLTPSPSSPKLEPCLPGLAGKVFPVYGPQRILGSGEARPGEESPQEG